MNSLANGQVPIVWQNKAYPSLRGLGSWLTNLADRCGQLEEFTRSPDEDMKMVYINRLFNPQSYLTAIKQIKAKADSLDLDKLSIRTDIINKTIEEVKNITQGPQKKDGAYIFGLFVEGARASKVPELRDFTGTAEGHEHSRSSRQRAEAVTASRRRTYTRGRSS